MTEMHEINTSGWSSGMVLTADGCGGVRPEYPPGVSGAAGLELGACCKCSGTVQASEPDWFRGVMGFVCGYCRRGMDEFSMARELGLDEFTVRHMSGTDDLERVLRGWVETRLGELEARFKPAADEPAVDPVPFDLMKVSHVSVIRGRRRETWFALELEDGSLDPLSTSRALEGVLRGLEALRGLDRTRRYTVVQVADPGPGAIAVEVIERMAFEFDGRGKLRPELELAAGRIADDPDYP